MKVRKRITTLAMALILGAAALSGCGNAGTQSSTQSQSAQEAQADTAAASEASQADAEEEGQTASGEAVTITFALWDEAQSVVYQELIDRFEEQNPDIKVELQLTPWSTFFTKFDAAAGADQAADTFFMNGQIEKYAAAGVLEPLDSYMERDGFDFDLYTQSAVENGMYNGVHYAVPKGTDSLAVVLNVALFEKYGVEVPDNDWTWDDMMAICKELKEKIAAAGDSGYPMAFCLDSSGGSWQPVIYQFGGLILNEDGTSAYTNEEDIAAIQALVDMIDEGYIPDYQMISDTSAEDYFISGQACMLYLATYSAQKIDQAEMENIKLIQLPTAESKTFITANMHYGMNAAGEHKEESWRFLNYLASEEANDIIAQNGTDLAARISSQQYYAGSFKTFDGTAFVDDVALSVPNVSTPAEVSAAVRTITSEDIIAIFSREIGVQEGMEKMAADINAELEKVK